jgi:uncharacterized protein YlxW (UPF0749 family)
LGIGPVQEESSEAMTIEQTIAYLGALALIVGAFTALFTQIFGASKVSFNQLKKLVDDLKKSNEALRADNMTLQETNQSLRNDNQRLLRQVRSLKEQVKKLKAALDEAVKLIEKYQSKKESDA